MKLDVAYSKEQVEVMGVEKSQEFGFSKDAQEMIFTMFTKNIYSNPIGSVVREITSNCFDSHKEAGVNDAVVVKLTKENADYYISFVDNGVGMSRERITKVYAQYFNSTKRNDNNQIGGFGIGGKTPLAYAESFFLITRYEGTKYTYSIRKGTKSPVLDLLAKESTTERNGTTIKIPVKSSDLQTFEREILRQLYYFENVIFEGFSTNVKNDYKIIEGKNFLYRGKEYDTHAHICLGRVAYPIDFNVFDVNDLDDNHWGVPIAIKVDIGEINVTVSREAIDYTEATKKLIRKKLNEAKTELTDMLVKQHEKLNSLEDYYQVENSYADLLLTDGYVINIQPMILGNHRAAPVLKKLNGILVPGQTQLVNMFYDVSQLGKKGKRDRSWDKSIKTIANENVYLVGDKEETPRKKNAYMKHTFKYYYAIKRKAFTPLELKKIIKDITPDKSIEPTKIVFQQFRELQKDAQKLIEARVKKYSSITVPEGFTVTQSKYDPNYELPVTFISRYGHDRYRHKLTNLEETKATFYYGTGDDENLLLEYRELYDTVYDHNETKKSSINGYRAGYPVRFVQIAKSNIKYISDFKNFKPIDEAKNLFHRKRESIIKHIEKENFFAVYNKINKLFLNEKLYAVLDPQFAKMIIELKKQWRIYHAIPNSKIYLGNGTFAKKIFQIEPTNIKFKGENLIKIIKNKEEKNGMMHYIDVDDDFDPKGSHYTQKEMSNVMQLLNLAYVK